MRGVICVCKMQSGPEETRDALMSTDEYINEQKAGLDLIPIDISLSYSDK